MIEMRQRCAAGDTLCRAWLGWSPCKGHDYLWAETGEGPSESHLVTMMKSRALWYHSMILRKKIEFVEPPWRQRQNRASKLNTAQPEALENWTWYRKITRAVILPHSNSGHDPNFCASDTSQRAWTNNGADLSTLSLYFTNKSVFVYRKHHSSHFKPLWNFLTPLLRTWLEYPEQGRAEFMFVYLFHLKVYARFLFFPKWLLIILAWSVITVPHGNTHASLPHFQKAMIILKVVTVWCRGSPWRLAAGSVSLPC